MSKKLTAEKAQQMLQELHNMEQAHGLSLRAEYYVQALEHFVSGGWIKCSDRMPEQYKHVLIFTTETKEVLEAYLNKDEEFCFDTDTYGDEETCMATHWVSLPEAPL